MESFKHNSLWRRLLAVALAVVLGMGLGPAESWAQQYDCMPGLIHVPTACMDSVGTARIGAHHIRQGMLPAKFSYSGSDGQRHKYDTGTYYMGLTPLSWFCVSFNNIVVRRTESMDSYIGKDRHISARIRPLPEGRYWPAVAIGVQDLLASSLDGNTHDVHFANYYAAASKHINLPVGKLGMHATYRHYLKTNGNIQFEGLVGGLTYNPSFAPKTRAAVEWDGSHINMSVQALVWRHFLLQISLEDTDHLTGGICWQTNLL